LNSFCTERFWAGYEALPVSARLTADKNYGLWRLNPQHLLLRFKSVGEGF
jgi:hypothetical protein